ncbi:MAG: hypothetical protein ACI9MC_003934 [Kiritimatiellia bacterium]|jgi:hypothetical protein
MALDGRTGEVLWSVYNRNYIDVAVADLNKDGRADIIASSAGDLNPDDSNDTGARVTVFTGEGDGWAPAQTWWHQLHFAPSGMRADGRVADVPGVRKHPHLGIHRAAFNPEPLNGGGAEPRVRIVDVCEDDCTQGAVWVWVQVGNGGVLDVDLPLHIELAGVVDGARQILATEPVEDVLERARWRAGQAIRVEHLGGPLTELRASLVGEGWRPAPCDEDGLVCDWPEAVCLD